MITRMSQWFRTYGFAEVYDDLLIGAYPQDSEDVVVLESFGVQRVLNLVDEHEYNPGVRAAVETGYIVAEIEERRRSLIDYGNLPGSALDSAVGDVLGWLEDGQRVYVHCRAGQQRSAAVAAAVVAISEGIDIDAAMQRVQERKPTASPLEHQRADLRRWWAARNAPPEERTA
jgi:atypical dual specificity phosphatase